MATPVSRQVDVVAVPPAGSLDPGLNNSGTVVVPIGGGTNAQAQSFAPDAEGNAVALQSDGKIVVAGYGQDNNGNQDFRACAL